MIKKVQSNHKFIAMHKCLGQNEDKTLIYLENMCFDCGISLRFRIQYSYRLIIVSFMNLMKNSVSYSVQPIHVGYFVSIRFSFFNP